MLQECTGIENWFNCLTCKLLSTNLCPLEGENVIDKIVNRIKMADEARCSAVKK